MSKKFALRSDYGDILLDVARNYPLLKSAEELMRKYNLTRSDIGNAVRRLRSKGVRIRRANGGGRGVMRNVIAELRSTHPQLFSSASVTRRLQVQGEE